MRARVRDAALWVVVAVLAILAILGTRSSSEPRLPDGARVAHRLAPDVAPAAAAVPATVAPVAPNSAEALATVADVHAPCATRNAAIDQLRDHGDPAAIPALTAIARGNDCIADAARTAVRELGRRSTADY
jgi:hypothetical protein